MGQCKAEMCRPSIVVCPTSKKSGLHKKRHGGSSSSATEWPSCRVLKSVICGPASLCCIGGLDFQQGAHPFPYTTLTKLVIQLPPIFDLAQAGSCGRAPANKSLDHWHGSCGSTETPVGLQEVRARLDVHDETYRQVLRPSNTLHAPVERKEKFDTASPVDFGQSGQPRSEIVIKSSPNKTKKQSYAGRHHVEPRHCLLQSCGPRKGTPWFRWQHSEHLTADERAEALCVVASAGFEMPSAARPL